MSSRKLNKAGAIAFSLVAFSALGGCVMDAPGGRFAARPTGIDGNWRNTEGLYNASFANQNFRWTDIASGQVLVSGSYTSTAPNAYRLTLVSASSGETKLANCNLASSQLRCTRDDGVQFSLYRT